MLHNLKIKTMKKIQVVNDIEYLVLVWDWGYAITHAGQTYFAEIKEDGWAYIDRAKFPPDAFEILE